MNDELKPSLKGLDLPELVRLLEPLGARAFHARQIMAWFYQRGVSDFSQMTDLSMKLREGLMAGFRADELRIKTGRTSRDGSRKVLYQAGDGKLLESVLIPSPGRFTACLSTQLGCRLQCAFCATGAIGFERDLAPGEIVDQLFHLQHLAGWENRITNVVFMGMGEPLLNYARTLAAARLINSHRGFNIGARHITISTAGVVPGILRLAREPEQFKLAISLNATTDQARSRLMPINRKHPINELLAAAREYTKIRGKLVFFEYILLSGVNDTQDDARRLAELLRGIPGKVNLIPFNPGDGSQGLRPSTPQSQQAFFDSLHRLGVPVTIRMSKGRDIKAACGQLRALSRNV